MDTRSGRSLQDQNEGEGGNRPDLAWVCGCSGVMGVIVSRPTIGNYVVRFGQFWSRFGIYHDLCNLPVVVGSIIVPEVSVNIVMKYLKGFYN